MANEPEGYEYPYAIDDRVLTPKGEGTVAYIVSSTIERGYYEVTIYGIRLDTFNYLLSNSFSIFMSEDVSLIKRMGPVIDYEI